MMVWNDKLLFIHPPKTGGTSISQHLLKHLPGAQGHTKLSHGHLGIDKACAVTGRDIDSFDHIIVPTRHPCDIVVSAYHFLKTSPKVADVAGKFKRLACEHPLDVFACCYRWPDHPFYTTQGHMPGNLRLMRFEEMNVQFPVLCRSLGIPDKDLPHENKTEHGDWRQLLDLKTRQHVFLNFPYIKKSFYYHD